MHVQSCANNCQACNNYMHKSPVITTKVWDNCIFIYASSCYLDITFTL